MGDVLTLAEIEKNFVSERVLLEDPRTNQLMQREGGTVVAHGKDRDEVYRLLVTLRPRKFVIVFTGKLPKDAAIAP